MASTGAGRPVQRSKASAAWCTHFIAMLAYNVKASATYDPLRGSLMNAAKSAFDAGFLGREMPDLSSLYDLSLLNQVLAEKGKKAIQ